MSRFVLTGVLAAASITSSCAQPDRFNQLQTQVSDLTSKVTDLQSQLAEVKKQISLSDLEKNFDTIAYLTPGSKGYSIVRTELGPITISLEDIQPYANGSKVRLRFGNVTSATLNDVNATIEWGRVDDKGSPDNANSKSKQESFVNPFRPGSWNDVDVILEGLPPTSLGFVRLSEVHHSAINLRR